MKKTILLILTIALVVLLVSCSALTNKTYNTFSYFDTIISLNVSIEKENSQAAWNEITSNMQQIENAVSVYKEGSDIDKFNKAQENTTIEISKLSYDILSFAKEAYEKTSGAYNPAMYLLSDLWGFTDRFMQNYEKTTLYDRENPKEELPQEKYIEGFLSLTDFSKVTLEEADSKYYIFKPDVSITIDEVKYTMQLDLGGIVKGYATGVINNIIDSYDIKYGYSSLGSSSLVLFERNEKGETWELSLKDPNNTDAIYLKTKVINSYVSTSGNYEQYYEIDGKRYCHIINPTTGCPVDNGNLSATCIQGIYPNDLSQASLIDAYSTALMVMDLETAKQFIEKENILASIALNNGDGNKVYTNMTTTSIANYEVIE